MAGDTREQFLDVAEALFAERGFYGVSIAAIADELGLTKQALLHHFGSKEKLYGKVLQRMSDRFDVLELAVECVTQEPGERLKAYLLQLYMFCVRHKNQTRLLTRELLDNQRRADTVAAWYLKPFLDRLIAMVKALPHWRNATDAEALASLYQLLGAINYYAISEPTLVGMFGADTYAEIDHVYYDSIERLIEKSVLVNE